MGYKVSVVQYVPASNDDEAKAKVWQTLVVPAMDRFAKHKILVKKLGEIQPKVFEYRVTLVVFVLTAQMESEAIMSVRQQLNLMDAHTNVFVSR